MTEVAIKTYLRTKKSVRVKEGHDHGENFGESAIGLDSVECVFGESMMSVRSKS